MKLKSAKTFCFPILFIFFGLGHFSEALNYSNSIDFEHIKKNSKSIQIFDI